MCLNENSWQMMVDVTLVATKVIDTSHNIAKMGEKVYGGIEDFLLGSSWVDFPG